GNESRSYLMLDLHHIITDGVSMDIFIHQLTSLYNGETLSPVGRHYKDFSQWQQQSLHTPEFKKQETWWLEQFSDNVPALNLPTDFPRWDERNFEGAEYDYYLDPQIAAGIKQLASDTGSTLFMVLLAAYTMLLSMYTGEGDIVVGTGTAGRRHADLDNMIGLFVNMLPLRNRPNKEKTIIEFLADVKKNTLQAFANQDYPY
ncbi:MAG: hypothetical protein GY940_13770, partial [bacterium]|nr:hypothetical protein [bacterium]